MGRDARQCISLLIFVDSLIFEIKCFHRTVLLTDSKLRRERFDRGKPVEQCGPRSENSKERSGLVSDMKI